MIWIGDLAIVIPNATVEYTSADGTMVFDISVKLTASNFATNEIGHISIENTTVDGSIIKCGTIEYGTFTSGFLGYRSIINIWNIWIQM